MHAPSPTMPSCSIAADRERRKLPSQISNKKTVNEVYTYRHGPVAGACNSRAHPPRVHVVGVIHELLDTSEGAGKRLVPDRPPLDTINHRLHPLHLRLEFPDGTGEADSMNMDQRRLRRKCSVESHLLREIMRTPKRLSFKKLVS